MQQIPDDEPQQGHDSVKGQKKGKSSKPTWVLLLQFEYVSEWKNKSEPNSFVSE